MSSAEIVVWTCHANMTQLNKRFADFNRDFVLQIDESECRNVTGMERDNWTDEQ